MGYSSVMMCILGMHETLGWSFNTKKNNIFKMVSQAWWLMPEILALWKQVGGLLQV